MKEKHKEAYRIDSRAILQNSRIPLGEDFYALNQSQLDSLENVADIRRYQKPKNANGSRLRYFHDMLQRRAK